MTKVTAPTGDAARLDGLRQVGRLASVGVPDLETLAGRCTVRTVVRGATVFEEGAPADALHVVLTGRVKIVRS